MAASNGTPMGGPSRVPSRSAGNGTTPVMPQRRAGRAQDSTMPASQKMPVSRHQRGGESLGSLQQRADTTAVTGPAAWDNGRDMVGTNRSASLTGAQAADADPCC